MPKPMTCSSFTRSTPEVVRDRSDPRPGSRTWRIPPCRPQIVLGDARLSLAHAQPGRFDLILLDAFSSDSIPVHLITREAFEIYKRHLGPEGLIITHVSNRHLECVPPSRASPVGWPPVR